MVAAGIVSLDGLTSGPTVRVGRRFLPVAASVFPPPGLPPGDRLLVAPGTPVHAVGAGRVTTAEGTAVGEVVLRIDAEIRLVYRGLQPSSVTVRRGQRVEAGDILGVVASDAGSGVATLELVASRADGTPVDVAALVVGAADPLELFLVPPRASAPAPARRIDRPRRRAHAPSVAEATEPGRDDAPAGRDRAARLVSRRRPSSGSKATADTTPSRTPGRTAGGTEHAPEATSEAELPAAGSDAATGPTGRERSTQSVDNDGRAGSGRAGPAATPAGRLAARRDRPGRR